MRHVLHRLELCRNLLVCREARDGDAEIRGCLFELQQAHDTVALHLFRGVDEPELLLTGSLRRNVARPRSVWQMLEVPRPVGVVEMHRSDVPRQLVDLMQTTSR